LFIETSPCWIVLRDIDTLPFNTASLVKNSLDLKTASLSTANCSLNLASKFTTNSEPSSTSVVLLDETLSCFKGALLPLATDIVYAPSPVTARSL
jgi:hypothetical protein